MDIVNRPSYLDMLCKWRDVHLIKVLTGVRRAGKSTLLKLFRDELVRDGVGEENITYINFEDFDFDFIKTASDLWDYLKPRIAGGGKKYVFLDEIQRVAGFEKAVDGLFVKDGVDVYLTGSNAHLLSGELATYLSGRYVTIQVHTLSFKEYCQGRQMTGNREKAWADYLQQGSFPQILALNNDTELIDAFNAGLYHTILHKDVLTRTGYGNIPAFQRIVAFLFDNIGNASSVRSIAGALASDGLKIAPGTVDSCIGALCDAFLFHRVGAIDVQGREHLKTGCKYYAADIGLRRHLLGSRAFDRGHMLENIIYLELKRRHREVFIGRHGTREIDFVVRDGGDIGYYQVAETIGGELLREREFGVLRRIMDNYPKTVLTLDAMEPTNDGGIRCINALDFLLEDRTSSGEWR